MLTRLREEEDSPSLLAAGFHAALLPLTSGEVVLQEGGHWRAVLLEITSPVGGLPSIPPYSHGTSL